MRFQPLDPPRRFTVGFGPTAEMTDCGRVDLAPDEQVTFCTPAGGEYDVARKTWGFYATPSLNRRLPSFGLRGVLVKNRRAHFFVLLVEQGREAEFHDYCQTQRIRVVCWLDGSESLSRLEEAVTIG